MARMIFENDDSSKQIVVTVREEEENTKFDVEFKNHSTEDFESSHYILFRFFMESLNRNSELEVTAIE